MGGKLWTGSDGTRRFAGEIARSQSRPLRRALEAAHTDGYVAVTFHEGRPVPLPVTKMSARNPAYVHRPQLVLNQFFSVNILFFIPTDRKLLPVIQRTIADAGDRELTLRELPPEYQRSGRAEGVVGSIVGVLLIAAICFMTTKPELG